CSSVLLKNMVGKYLQKTVRTEPEAAFPYRSQWACAIYPQTNWQKKVTIKTYWSRNHFLLRRRKRQSRQSFHTKQISKYSSWTMSRISCVTQAKSCKASIKS